MNLQNLLEKCRACDHLPTTEECVDAILHPETANPQIKEYLRLSPKYEEYLRLMLGL